MRRSSAVAVCLSLAIACQGKDKPGAPPASSSPGSMSTSTQGALTDEAVSERGRAFVALLAAGKHAEAAATFAPTVREALPATKLATTWEEVIGQAGTFETIVRTSVVRTPSHVSVHLTCKFARAEVVVKVSYDADGKVAGLYFAPAEAPAPAYVEPPYVDRARIEEREVVVGAGGEWPLPGTLTLPRGPGPFRAVVLVHGSGPQDRDETLGPNRPFKDLAGGLASRGIAVLRYEKRTKALSMKFVGLRDATLEDEVIADARAAVALLRATTEIDPAHVVVAGHSLGGFVAPRIAAGTPDIAAIAILAGNTRPIADMIVEQLDHIARVDPARAAAIAKQRPEMVAAAERVRALQDGAAPKPGEQVLGAGGAYWKDLGAYDPRAVAATLNRPIFVAQGGRDYQVTTVDFERWKEALSGRPGVTFKLYPELNHLFAPGTGPSNPAEYATRTPVDVRLVEDLAAWVRAL